MKNFVYGLASGPGSAPNFDDSTFLPIPTPGTGSGIPQTFTPTTPSTTQPAWWQTVLTGIFPSVVQTFVPPSMANQPPPPPPQAGIDGRTAMFLALGIGAIVILSNRK